MDNLAENTFRQAVLRAQAGLAVLAEDFSPEEDINKDGLTVSRMSVQSSEEWPDISPVKAQLLPVSALPLTMVPAPFRDWVGDVSERMQCPPDFVAAAMLVMAGSIIDAGCGIRPKKHDDWTVVPNLWGGVVARPSMLKTPAINEGLKPMKVLECAAKKAFDDELARHSAEMEAFKAQREALQGEMRQVAKGKGKAALSMDGLKHDFVNLQEQGAPIWRRYKTNDATIEKWLNYRPTTRAAYSSSGMN